MCLTIVISALLAHVGRLLMDYGSGWLVSLSGVWVPVAYNASVDMSLGWRRASFMTNAGNRVTASRGREPRTWEVSETIPYDWAQALEHLWLSEDSSDPMFWVPPMAGLANIAPPVYPFKANLGLNSMGWPAVSSPLDADEHFVSGFFPIRQGMKLEFGAALSGGGLICTVYDSTLAQSRVLGVAVAGKDGGQVSTTVEVTDPAYSWGRLSVTAGGTSVSDIFARPVSRVMGVRFAGAGGAWVTLEDAQIGHGATSPYTPLMKCSLSLRECER